MNCLPTQINSIGNFLSDLIENTNDIAHLKDIHTMRYIQCNTCCAEYMGFEQANIINDLPVRDLERIWKCESDIENYFNLWRGWRTEINRRIEYQALVTQRPVSVESISITSTGFVHIDNMTRFPVLSSDNRKVIAVLNLGHYLTNKYSISSLFNLYRRFYPEWQAIKFFLRYLNIESYFLQPPTLQEMRILLAMRTHSKCKYVAKIFNLSPGTVEHYISNLYDKLTIRSLYDILVKLRKIPDGENDTLPINK